MKVRDKHIVVTGGANGIGKELCRRFHEEGARAIVVADLEMERAAEVAAGVGGLAVATDVSTEADVEQLVQMATMVNGPIDLFCSNAGIFIEGGVETTDADWSRILAINVMAHVYAARAVLPAMIARGEGYFLTTASAAGLLSQIGSASYAVTKHAAIAFAEWLAISHGDQGIKVSCLCPQGVRTRMLLGEDGEKDSFLKEGSVTVKQVADAVIKGLEAERFLILPHPEVLEYFQRKAGDYDRWLRGMRKLQERVQ
jgi:NAD(P)-dependent dehydrogenase (short-subunit alcohol dehydrogenase family)